MNRKNLVREIEEFVASLNDLKEKIDREDEAGVQALMRQSTRRRRYFDR